MRAMTFHFSPNTDRADRRRDPTGLSMTPHVPIHPLSSSSRKSRRLLPLAAGLALALPLAARADDTPEPVAVAAADADAALAEVVVTGFTRGVQRSVADSPAPIDVIGGEQLAQTGRAELGEALSKLLPSFNFGTNQAGVNSIVRPVINRGLGPAYTLVLVNGKRRHNGSLLTNGGNDTSGVNAVDLDMIPTSAVERIEVLKDSAAAQYGSDAIAGVINVVLKSSASGGHLGATWGSLYDGKGDLDSGRVESDFGLHLGDGGFIHFSADARERGMAWWNFPASNRVIYGSSYAGDPRNAEWNGDGAHNGDPQVHAANLSYNAELPVGDSVTLYSFATVGTRKTEMGNNFRRPNGLGNINQLYPDGFFPVNNTREYDFQFVGGGRGEWLGWKLDASTSYGKNWVRQYSDRTINPSLGPVSPTSFDNLATYQFEQWVQNFDATRAFDLGWGAPLQWSWGAEWRAERFTTYAGDPLGLLNGGYVFQAGDQPGDPNVGKPASVGAQGGVVLSAADAVRLTRNNVALYTDFGQNLTDKWFVDLALRGEHYDDSAGNTLGIKLNSRYDFTPAFALRGTLGSGFRAPSLTQIGYAQTDNRTNIDQNGNIVPSLSKLVRNNSALGRTLGTKDLDPEKSWNAGFGFVLQPLDRLNVTIDAYHIEIDDRIIRTGYLSKATLPGLEQVLIDNGLTGNEWVQYFANAADTRTNGVDVVADSPQDYGVWGKVRWSAAFNWNKAEVDSIKAAPAAVQALAAPGTSAAVVDALWYPVASQNDLTVANPQTKLILGAAWTLSRLSTTVQTTRYGSYVFTYPTVAAPRYDFGAKWLTDIDVGYAFDGGVKLSVGATNVFDVRPDKSGPIDPNTGTAALTYGPSPFAPSGGYYYGKLAYDF
jgi:iron complex outermembrane receptor protein